MGASNITDLGITFRLEIFAMLSDLQAKQETSFISGTTLQACNQPDWLK